MAYCRYVRVGDSACRPAESGLRVGHGVPVDSRASRLRSSMHIRASAAVLKPMFQSSRAFLIIMQFLSVHEEPNCSPPTIGNCTPVDDDPMQVSLESVLRLVLSGDALESPYEIELLVFPALGLNAAMIIGLLTASSLEIGADLSPAANAVALIATASMGKACLNFMCLNIQPLQWRGPVNK